MVHVTDSHLGTHSACCAKTAGAVVPRLLPMLHRNWSAERLQGREWQIPQWIEGCVQDNDIGTIYSCRGGHSVRWGGARHQVAWGHGAGIH